MRNCHKNHKIFFTCIKTESGLSNLLSFSCQYNENCVHDIYRSPCLALQNCFFFQQLDYKVGWKKLKEVFGMAGMVVRTDILEDKDGKSRGMGTVTFEMPIEAVQAVCILQPKKQI